MNADHALVEMSDASTTDDGKAVEFRLRTANGESLNIAMPAEALEKFINDLAHLAQAAARVRTNDRPIPFEESAFLATTLSEAQATALGLAEGQNKSMYLLVRLHAVDLSFQIETKDLIGWGESLVLAGKTLQADTKTSH